MADGFDVPLTIYQYYLKSGQRGIDKTQSQDLKSSFAPEFIPSQRLWIF